MQVREMGILYVVDKTGAHELTLSRRKGKRAQKGLDNARAESSISCMGTRE